MVNNLNDSKFIFHFKNKISLSRIITILSEISNPNPTHYPSTHSKSSSRIPIPIPILNPLSKHFTPILRLQCPILIPNLNAQLNVALT